MPKRYTLTRSAGRTQRTIPYEKELNADQLQVVGAGTGPMLVLAGPGSGKTRTLTYRVAHLIEQGIHPQNILLVTFTVKAAREMLDRLEGILGVRPDGLWGGTFHHIGNLLLRRHADAAERTVHFGILDEEDARNLVGACLQDLTTSFSKTRLPQASVLESLMSFSINTARPLEEVVSARTPQFIELIPLIEKVQALYQTRKQRANLMDYDDLLTHWLKLLTDHPSLAKRYTEQFQYILVDEYQDTNQLQFDIIRNLSGQEPNTLVVGDDAQSIYRFRGAELRNLLKFPEYFPGTQIVRLETNYRSTPEILNLANASIELNQGQFKKKLKAVQPPGDLPAVVPLMNSKQQAAFVAQRILELREEGTSLEEIGVLMRARFQSAELELELARRNIPYVVRGGVRFFEQAHIKDVMAYLRIVTNPTDELAWERVLCLQEGIGRVTARQVWETLSGEADPLGSALRSKKLDKIPKRARASFKILQEILSGLTQPSKKLTLPEMMALILQTGYEAYLKERFENAQDRREDIEQLMNLSAQYKDVSKFIEDLTLREPFRGESSQGWEEPDELLTLSTIHQAKGLEWHSVFLIGLVDGQFPHQKSLEEPEELEEERRLFYVAVTRTKKELYLTYPLTRYTYQKGEVLLRPSQFIQEVPDQFFELWRVGEENPIPEPDWPV